jgi:hypothetical protein
LERQSATATDRIDKAWGLGVQQRLLKQKPHHAGKNFLIFCSSVRRFAEPAVQTDSFAQFGITRIHITDGHFARPATSNAWQFPLQLTGRWLTPSSSSAFSPCIPRG